LLVPKRMRFISIAQSAFYYYASQSNCSYPNAFYIPNNRTECLLLLCPQ
jgi:hypothetical protein